MTFSIIMMIMRAMGYTVLTRSRRAIVRYPAWTGTLVFDKSARKAVWLTQTRVQ
jgi:hypothetical protein